MGFSLQKLIVLAAIVAAVWYGFRWLSRYQQVQRDLEKERVARAAKPAETTRREAASEDLVACPRCGAFVPAGSPHDCAGSS